MMYEVSIVMNTAIPIVSYAIFLKFFLSVCPALTKLYTIMSSNIYRKNLFIANAMIKPYCPKNVVDTE